MGQPEANRADTLADDLQLLLGALCREWGFCNALADDLIDHGNPLTPDAFATAILAAEGLSAPDSDSKWRPELKRLFVQRYGAAVCAEEYARPPD